MVYRRTYSRQEATAWSYPNHWDAAAFCLVLGVLVLISFGISHMSMPYEVGQSIPISLDPSYLPYYALRSVLRMLIALGFSLLFTLTIATLAAKNKHAERIIIPAIDVLQSAPILSFLTIATVAFIALFPHSLLGPECASIFVIFISQVWNMALSFYQSLRTVPAELVETTRVFRLNAWQRFWRLEVPFAMPGLVWNSMLSMSASWFFVVASEAISVANQQVTLPGIGSYIAMAILHKNLHAVFYSIAAMLIVITIYDQLLFRPLVYWLEHFKEEHGDDEIPAGSWVVTLFQRTRLLKRISPLLAALGTYLLRIRLFSKRPLSRSNNRLPRKKSPLIGRIALILWYGILSLATIATAFILLQFIFSSLSAKESKHVLYLGVITGLRVMVLIALSSLVWVPVGVWIGLRPRVAARSQSIIQFLAAFPVNLVYPVAVTLIITYHLNINIWTSPLIILGTQWYILFNVIAGTMTFPKELCQAMQAFHIKGWLKWRRFILPGIFPFFVTGAITAAGGAWNASVVAEAVSWGQTHLTATGLGAYISTYAQQGDFHRLVLGTTIMCLYVLLLNQFVWRRLYNLADNRFRMSL